jgi:hypothetical protein
MPHRVRLGIPVQEQERRAGGVAPRARKEIDLVGAVQPRRESIEPRHGALRVQPTPILVLARLLA